VVWWVVGAGGDFVAEGTSGVYDSLIYAVYDAWDPRYKVLHVSVDDCRHRLSQLMGLGIRLVG